MFVAAVSTTTYNAAMAKKKPVSATTANRTGKAVNAWINPDLHASLQAYLDAQRPKPTLTSVIEVAIEDFLRAQGFRPPADAEEDT